MGRVPAGKRGVITALESGPVPEGTRLEIGGPDALLYAFDASRQPGHDGPSFGRTLKPPLVVEGPRDVWVRCSSEQRVHVDLLGFTQ